jgi:Tfp pilus assembly protein PilE
MITVAIVAILAAIAYPNYRDYVIRGQLADANNGLPHLCFDRRGAHPGMTASY